MSAETQLYNPAIFVRASQPLSSFDVGLHPPHTELAREYLAISRELRTKPSASAMKGHLFKLMRPGLVRETDLRERLGKIKGDGMMFDAFSDIVKEMKVRMEVREHVRRRAHSLTSFKKSQADAADGESQPPIILKDDGVTARNEFPHWSAQPYIRSL